MFQESCTWSPNASTKCDRAARHPEKHQERKSCEFGMPRGWVNDEKIVSFYNLELETEVVTLLLMMADPKLSRLSNFGCLRDGSESLQTDLISPGFFGCLT